MLMVQSSKTSDKDTKARLVKESISRQDEAEILAEGKKSLLTDAGMKAEERALADIAASKKAEEKALASRESVTTQKDYKARSGGYALLSKGDVVVNAKNMSSGVGGDLGAFAGTAASDMIRSMPSSSSGVAPQIPVNINIGSVSGDPEQFLNRIKPAIEQTFERMFYEKQKRR